VYFFLQQEMKCIKAHGLHTKAWDS